MQCPAAFSFALCLRSIERRSASPDVRFEAHYGLKSDIALSPKSANNGSHGFPDFLFCEPHIGTGALSSLSSLRLLQLSGASRDSGHPVWPRASPSSPPTPPA